MPADVVRLSSAARVGHPGTVLARLTAAKAIRSAAIWGLAFGLYVAVSALSYVATYKTALSRTQLAASFGSSFGINAIFGPARQLSTVAGFVAWRSVGVLGLIGGVWGLLAGTRLLRGEEDAGRWELLLVGHTTRRGATAKALAGLGLGLLTLWGVTAVIAAAVGRGNTVHVDVWSAMFLALAPACSAAMFLAVGALCSQLVPTRRQAAGCAAGALAVSYALRLVADSGTGLGWLRWFSPLGWVEELQPLTGPRPLMLLPVGICVAVFAGLAIQLAGVRDVGASTIPDRSSLRPHTALLTGPTGLALRLTRGTAIGWAAAIAVLGLVMGWLAKSVGDVLSQDAGDREAFARMGLRGSGVQQYLAMTFLIVALVAGLVASSQMIAARTEEAEGRLDHLLVRPVSRRVWLAGRLAVGTGYLVAGGLIAAVASWLGVASRSSGVALPTLLRSGLNVVPPAVFVLGIGALVFGLRPRWVSIVTWALLAWSFLTEMVGGDVNASHWVLDTSLFHQMAAAPASQPNWTTGCIMVALGLAAAGVGSVAFGRRDLVGE